MKYIANILFFFCFFPSASWGLVSEREENSLVYPAAEKKQDFQANLGWAIGFGPAFWGSSKNEFKHRPMVDIRYKDRLRIFGPKLYYMLYKNDGLSMGALLNYDFGRKERDSPVLAGLGDNDGVIEIGAFIHYRYKPASFNFHVGLTSGLGADTGEILTASIIQGLYRKEDFSFSLILQTRLFSGQAMQRTFGITKVQSENSSFQLAPYTPAGGFGHIGSILLGRYNITKRTSVMMVGGLWQLMDNAERSPLVKSDFGSSLQSIYGIALLQKF